MKQGKEKTKKEEINQPDNNFCVLMSRLTGFAFWKGGGGGWRPLTNLSFFAFWRASTRDLT